MRLMLVSVARALQINVTVVIKRTVTRGTVMFSQYDGREFGMPNAFKS